MKIGPTGFCTFTATIWPQYMDMFAEHVHGIITAGECPLKPRPMTINRHVLDSGMIGNPYVQPGLWKLYVTLRNDIGDLICIYVTVNVYGDGYFG